VRVRVARIGGARAERLELGVALAGLEQRGVERRGRLGHRVQVELERGRQADARLLADLGADHAGRALQRGGRPRTLLVGAVDGVEDRGVLQVPRHPHVGDRDEAEPRVLDPRVDHLRDDHLDAVGELACPRVVDHGSFPFDVSVDLGVDASAGRPPGPVEPAGRTPRTPSVIGEPCDQSRGFSRISNVSMMSPSVMSLNDPRPIPHSKPSRTSVTSSFSRRSDSMLRLSPTTVPPRSTRALVLRRMVPERTTEPAMLPNFEERKTWRISAVPSWTSSYSGLSMPLRAASTSSIAW